MLGDGVAGSPNTGWPRYKRLAAQPAPYVGPGQVAWFQFTAQAPSTPGTYRLSLRPPCRGRDVDGDYRRLLVRDGPLSQASRGFTRTYGA